MPEIEIGEVARIVHYLRKHLVNRTIQSCQGFEDDIVYGKVGASASAFSKAVEGRHVTAAGQQGKYFYLTLDKPPHPVLHVGMSGWVKFSAEETYYYKQGKEGKAAEDWPPKYMKFLLRCDAEKVDGEDRGPLEVAFVDARRLGRIRLVDCAAEDIRKTSPLKENGPDPVIDKSTVTVDWLAALMNRKKVPIKALLLDQANLSGIGNWVADEILYQARIHPEQYCNTFSGAEIERLHASLMEVCTTACELLADSTKFPESWLMKHRWGKGKKDSNVLPNGNTIIHLTVGGRTSAVVPAVQKKTGTVAGDVPAEQDAAVDGSTGNEDIKPARGRKRKPHEADDGAGEEAEEVMSAKKGRPAPKPNGRGKKTKSADAASSRNNRGPKTSEASTVKPKKEMLAPKAEPRTVGSRRSARTKSR